MSAAFFRGDRTRLTVAKAVAEPLVLDVAGPAPQVGDCVRVAADPAGILPLPAN